MNHTILVIRLFLLMFCFLGGFSIWYLYSDDRLPWATIGIALLIGALLILVDVFLKGFSLRGLSGLTFGLLAGLLCSHLISISPLFDGGPDNVIFISRVVVFVGVTYLSTVIALRGKDEFSLVIPYVRFAPEQVEAPILVLDASALIDGRVTKLSRARLLGDVLYVPKFVIDELDGLSGSTLEEERNRGQRGLKGLNDLRALEFMEVRVYQSELQPNQSVEEKMIFVVKSLKGRLVTASEAMVRRAKLDGVTFVELQGLAKAVAQEVAVGETLSVKLVKSGKEDGQGVGYLEDGSMVVISGGSSLIGTMALFEIESIIPTAGGRMVFGRLLGAAD